MNDRLHLYTVIKISIELYKVHCAISESTTKVPSNR